MGQLGFFDAEKRLAALSAKGDPLEAIDRLVPWESFRADIEAVVLTPDEMRKSSAGRKPIDAIVMFRMLVLQALHNLSDEQAEYQVRDRLSFTRFLRLGIEDSIPDATTLWLFREKLAKAGLIEKLFDRFDQHLAAQGYMARGGQMIDATIVPVPKQRNSRDENETVKAGGTPAEWEKQAGQAAPEGPRRPLDEEARQELFRLQEPRECGRQAQADPALRGDRCGGARQPAARRALEQGQHVGGCVRRQRLSLGRDRGEAQGAAACAAAFIGAPPATIRCRMRKRERTAPRAESALASSMCSERSRLTSGGRIVRTIGIVRARAKIGLQNLAYNIRRLVTLERMAAA